MSRISSRVLIQLSNRAVWRMRCSSTRAKMTTPSLRSSSTAFPRMDLVVTHQTFKRRVLQTCHNRSNSPTYRLMSFRPPLNCKLPPRLESFVKSSVAALAAGDNMTQYVCALNVASVGSRVAFKIRSAGFSACTAVGIRASRAHMYDLSSNDLSPNLVGFRRGDLACRSPSCQWVSNLLAPWLVPLPSARLDHATR